MLYGCSSPDFSASIERIEPRRLRLLVAPAPGSQARAAADNAARIVLTTLAEAWKNLSTGANFTGRKLPPGESWLLHSTPQHQALFAPLLTELWPHDHQVSPKSYRSAREDLSRLGWQLDNAYYEGGRIVHLAGGSAIHHLTIPARSLGGRYREALAVHLAEASAGDLPTWRLDAEFAEEGWTNLVREGWQILIHSNGGFLCPQCHCAVEEKSYEEQKEAWEPAPKRSRQADPRLMRHVLVERYRCAWCGTVWEHDFTRLDYQ
jgi:hypothetical protein